MTPPIGAFDQVPDTGAVTDIVSCFEVELYVAVTVDPPTATPVTVMIAVVCPAGTVTVAGTEVHLTPIEFRLLVELARTPGRVLTHRQLLREVWGPGAVEELHYLRVHMAALRRKLEEDPARPKWLLTEAGVGYRLREPTHISI